jgi:hypothetical protein
VGRESLARTEQYSVLLESDGWKAMLQQLAEETIIPTREELLRGRYKTREELSHAQGLLEGTRRAVYSPYERFSELLDKPIKDIMPESVRRLFE